MRIVLIDTAYLGDLILATPLIRAAAGRTASGGIDLLTSPAGAAATRNHPLVEECHILDKRHPTRGSMREARLWLRGRKADAALLPRRSLRSGLLALRAGIPRRIGFRRGMVRWLCTDTVPHAGATHQAERLLRLARPLGVADGAPGGARLEMFPSREEIARVDGWLAERGLTNGFTALAPGSAWATKRWPAERFGRLAADLAGDAPVVLLSGPGEEPLVAEMREAAGKTRLEDPGVLSPTAAVHLLRHAGVLVANDSGALHMGEAAGVPVVGLYGPTVPEQGFAPRNPLHRTVGVEGLSCRPCGRHGARRCPLGHWRCMLELPPEKVAATVRELGSVSRRAGAGPGC